MAYCVMRIEKRKAAAIGGLQREANRELATEKYNNKVQLDKSKANIYLLQSKDWLHDCREVIRAAGAKERANSVVAIDGIYTASPNWFADKNIDEIRKYFTACLQFHSEHYGKTISAVIHLDEDTPHMHVLSVPLTKDGRLSARELVGNQTHMRELQTAFHTAVGKEFGLQRGISRGAEEKRTHITAQEHRIRQNEAFLQQQGETLRQVAENQLQACEVAIKAEERLLDLKETTVKLQKQNKKLRMQKSQLQKQVNRTKEKISSMETQTAQALKAKQAARAAERDAIAKCNIAEQHLKDIQALEKAQLQKRLAVIEKNEQTQSIRLQMQTATEYEWSR